MTTTMGDLSASGASASASDAYLAAVGDALAGVSDTDRQELLDDLAEHLAELAHESDAGLVDRLGPPERYAAELLASAGIEAGPVPAIPRPGWVERVRAVAAGLDSPQVAKLRVFERELQPGWWFVRGALVVVALGTRFGMHDPLSMPHGIARTVVYLVAIAAGIFVSLKIGRGPKWATWGATLLGVIALTVVLHANTTYINRVQAQAFEAVSTPQVSGQLTDPTGKPITNIYAFDTTGKPLRRVFLFDQDGIPIDVGNLQTLRGAGGTFVSGLFPQPNVIFDNATGSPRVEAPKPPRVAVPDLSQPPNPAATNKANGATPTTTANVATPTSMKPAGGG